MQGQQGARLILDRYLTKINYGLREHSSEIHVYTFAR